MTKLNPMGRTTDQQMIHNNFETAKAAQRSKQFRKTMTKFPSPSSKGGSGGDNRKRDEKGRYA